MKNPHDYTERINRAIDYVKRNLSEPLKLDDVARVAHFSPHHFHRIFRALVGETLHSFVKRSRLERALFVISNHPESSLTEIALACGFASSSDFSRSFRAHFGVPPRLFDVQHYRQSRREDMQSAAAGLGNSDRLARLPRGENPDGFEVALRDLPARRVAYLRVSDPYRGDGVAMTAEKLLDWAKQRGHENEQWLGYQWEIPEITELSKCHYDLGIVVPPSADVTGISVTTFAAMKVAEVEIAGTVDLELRALDWLYTTWLPTSGFVPDHHPGFEVFNGLPFEHGSEHFELRIHLAVREATWGIPHAGE